MLTESFHWKSCCVTVIKAKRTIREWGERAWKEKREDWERRRVEGRWKKRIRLQLYILLARREAGSTSASSSPKKQPFWAAEFACECLYQSSALEQPCKTALLLAYRARCFWWEHSKSLLRVYTGSYCNSLRLSELEVSTLHITLKCLLPTISCELETRLQ